jgi:hypothetical protein
MKANADRSESIQKSFPVKHQQNSLSETAKV